MAKKDKWDKQKKEHEDKDKARGHATSAKGIKGDAGREGGRKPAPAHVRPVEAPAMPKAQKLNDLRIDGDLDLSIFDDLEPDQDFMITPSQPTADHVYTVSYDPISGKQVVAATDPATIVTAPPDYSEVTSDGGTPSTPSITLVSGPGWIKVKWAASTGTSDPLYYKVFARAAADPTTADDTYLVASTQDLESVVNKLTGGTQLATGTTYHFAVKAYSRVSGGGTSAASTVVTGTPAVVDASVTTLSNLNAGTITTGTMSAAFIGTGTLSATVTVSGTIQTASSGARVTLDNTNGLRVFDGGATDYGAGAGVTIKLPISGDPFIRGTIKALSLSLRTDSGVSTVNSVRWLDPTTASELGYIMVGDNGSGVSPQGEFVTHPAADGDSANTRVAAYGGAVIDDEAAGVVEVNMNVADDGTAASPYLKTRVRDNQDISIDNEILLFNARQQSDLSPIGQIIMWPHVTSIPAGWLECVGQELNVSDYPELYDALCPKVQTTISNASPAVIDPVGRRPEWGAIGDNIDAGNIHVNTAIVFETTGSLPTGLTAGTVYYVKTLAPSTPESFTVSATRGGAAINTTSAGSGTHYFRPVPFGVGSGTFNLPDFRGRMPVGRDTTTDFQYEGITGGETTHALTTAELASHSHAVGTLAVGNESSHTHGAGTLSTPSHTLNFRYSQNATLTGSSDIIRSVEGQPAAQGTATSASLTHNITGSTGGGTSHTHSLSGSTATAGSGTAHNNLPPYLALCFIILAKVSGEPTYGS